MLDRKTPPPFNRNFSFNLIQPVHIGLSNGLEVQLISGGDQDVIKVELLFPAGRWVESIGGTSYFTSQLLSKGTTKKSSYEIAQIFDQYGAHLDVSPGLDFVSISLYALSHKLEVVLKLLVELLLDASFPEKELEQGKAIYLQNLKVNYEKTSFVASKLLRKNIFGEDHPYGRELEESGVPKIQQAHLIDFYKTFFHPAAVFVSGKIEKQAQQLIEDSLCRLPIKKSEEKIIKALATSPQKQHVEKDGSVQSSIRMGRKSVLRSHADYFDILFLNHVLGGYFGSRLMKNIREEKGLSYGIHSSLHALRHESYLAIGADVNTENRELTFEEVRKELHKLQTEKLEVTEIDTARYHFIGSLQSEMTTPFAHADKLKNILVFNLPQDHYQNMITRIQKMSAEDLMRIAEKYFKEDSFLEVSVG